MKQQRTAQIGYWLKVVTLGVVLGFGIQFAQAWTNPGTAAPGGNVAGPVNTGVLTQVKNGSLGLVGNLVANMIQVNGVATESLACSSNGLMARSASGELLSCRSGAWYKVSQAARLADMIKNGAGCPCQKNPFGCSSGTYPSGTSREMTVNNYKFVVTCFDGLEVQTDTKEFVPYGNEGGL